MLKKYVAKFAMDILPSVAATIIGAYIVNHYIVAKPGTGAPFAAAVSTAEPSPEVKAPAKAATKPSERSSDLANVPEAGVKAKGIAEKSILDKPTPEKPAEKSADKPSETASLPVETRRHQPAAREKTASKPIPAPVQSSTSQPSTSQPSTSAMASVVAAPNPAPPAEASVTPDANDLARAAIERLRGANDGSSRAQEAARIPDAPHVVSAPPVLAPLAVPPVRPLPPPIMVSTPSGETLDPRLVTDETTLYRRAGRRSLTPNAAGRHSAFAIFAAARSACRGRGAIDAGTHQCCRRSAVGCEIGVSRGVAE